MVADLAKMLGFLALHPSAATLHFAPFYFLHEAIISIKICSYYYYYYHV